MNRAYSESRQTSKKEVFVTKLRGFQMFCLALNTSLMKTDKCAVLTMKIARSSRPKVFCKKGVLRNFTKFTGKYLCLSLFVNKVVGKNIFFHRTSLIAASE